MKIFYFILLGLSLLITSCSKDKLAEDKLTNAGVGWFVKNFYVNDIDKTDSLLNITKDSYGNPWFYSFTEDGSFGGPWGWGSWSISDKGTRLETSVTNPNSAFLSSGIEIVWDLNYKKLINDDELWLVTNFNNKKYEAHFYSQ